jgi:predicted regulator of Ras-like GTPase activity (Roadblock/LC7/MglB family)
VTGLVRKLGRQLADSALTDTLCGLTRSSIESHFEDAGCSDPRDLASDSLVVALECVHASGASRAEQEAALARLAELSIAVDQPRHGLTLELRVTATSHGVIMLSDVDDDGALLVTIENASHLPQVELRQRVRLQLDVIDEVPNG